MDGPREDQPMRRRSVADLLGLGVSFLGRCDHSRRSEWPLDGHGYSDFRFLGSCLFRIRRGHFFSLESDITEGAGVCSKHRLDFFYQPGYYPFNEV